jgi:uncharacterized protein YdhG (YjbR/CyaY superfamily)
VGELPSIDNVNEDNDQREGTPMSPATKATTKKASAKKASTKRTTSRSTTRKTAPAFSTDEQAAMRARADEVKAARKKGGEDDEPALLAKIAEMPPQDRKLAERVHAIVRASGPDLTCRTWYGMPAYAKDGKVVCWFKAADKFKARYATIGFSDQAALDDGSMWPTEYAVTADFGQNDEAKLADLIKQAVR